jgi:hypothetical protein
MLATPSTLLPSHSTFKQFLAAQQVQHLTYSTGDGSALEAAYSQQQQAVPRAHMFTAQTLRLLLQAGPAMPAE